MRESRTYGSVRGALSNERPYRDRRACHRARIRANRRLAKTERDDGSALLQPHVQQPPAFVLQELLHRARGNHLAVIGESLERATDPTLKSKTLGAALVSADEARAIVTTWLGTPMREARG